MNDDPAQKPEPTPPAPAPVPETSPVLPADPDPQSPPVAQAAPTVESTQWADNVQPLPPKKQSFIEVLAKDRVQVILIGLGVVLLIAGAVYYFVFGAGNNASTQKDQQTSAGDQGSGANNNSDASGTESADAADTTTTETTPPADQPSPETPSVPSGGSTGSTGSTSTAKTYEISYTNTCFDPANRTIKLGDTIKFIDNSKTRSMWPASNNHPSHLLYPEFDPKKSIAPGGSWSFTFNKVGAWGYHDHLKSNCTGIITVQ